MPSQRVLVVDDEIEPNLRLGQLRDDVSGYMAYYLLELEDEGFLVTTAAGPDEALEVLKDGNTFDLIIVDLMMPPGQFGLDDTMMGMRTGARLAEKIHADNPLSKIVILSNNVYSHSRKDHDCQDLVDRKIVQRLFLKSDYTPIQLIEQLKPILSS